jgi:hypothetical protein
VFLMQHNGELMTAEVANTPEVFSQSVAGAGTVVTISRKRHSTSQ